MTKDMLNKKAVLAGEDKEAIKEAEKARRGQYKELQLRIQREKELNIVAQKLQLKKDLADSKNNTLKPKLIEKGTATKPAVYKWTYERKK